MIHPSHMTTDARDAYEARDLDALRYEFRKQSEVHASAASARHVPYGLSQRFSSVSERADYESHTLDAIYYGLVDLMGLWNVQPKISTLLGEDA